MRSIITKLALFLFPLAALAQINPGNQINWPTGPAGCVYAPGTNTCVTGGSFLFDRPGQGLFPPTSAVQFTNEEASVIYEGSPQILSSSYGKVFKMWYDAGWTSPDSALNYAESPDGLPGTWVQYTSNPVQTVCARSWVFKNGSTYHLYCSNGSSGSHVNHYTSSNGLSWTLSASSVITATQTWQSSAAGSAGNSAILINSGTWYDLQEWLSTDGNWRIGLWTSSDGNTWTAYSGNPIIPTNGMSSTGGCSGPWFGLISGTFYALLNCNGPNGTGTGVLPNDIYAFSSSNAQTWTALSSVPWLQRSTADEGIGLATAQVADPFLVEADVTGNGNPRTYLFYEATPNGNIAGTSPLTGLHMKVAIAQTTIANLFAGTVNDGAPKPMPVGADQCTPGSVESSAFSGPASLAVTSYTSPCGNTWATYSGEGISATAPILTGSNAIELSTGTYADALSSYTPPSANYQSSATFQSNNGSLGLFVRANSAADTNYFGGCTVASSICYIYKTVAGTPNQLGTTYSFTWSAGAVHTLTLSANGTSISLAIDGTVVIGPITDSSISSVGQAGIRLQAGASATSFAVQNLVATGSAITALTGDVAASGPGSAAATLATVNSGPGSCGDSTHVCQVTTNGKGLVTSQSQVSITGGGGSGNYVNIMSSLTATGCTISGGVCTVGTATGSITLTGIPSTYQTLKIFFNGTNSTSSAANALVFFNGDAGSNYKWTQIYSNGSSAPGGSNSTSSSGAVLCQTGQNGSYDASCEITVLQYAGTTFYKHAFSLLSTASTGGLLIVTEAAQWNNTAAINEVQMTPGAGNFNVGDTIVLYGLN